MFCALQVGIVKHYLEDCEDNKRCAVRFFFPFCNYTLPFVNINCHIYPFVIKLWYLLATDETVFIKNVSLL